MNTTDRKIARYQAIDRRSLAVDRRKTWEALSALKKRFANMVGKGSLTPAQLLELDGRLKDVKTLFEEYTTDVPTE